MLQLKDNAAGAGGGDRWQRAQLKRLRQVLALKASRDEGQTLSEAQEAKLKTEGRLRADLSAMGCDLSAVESEIRATAKVAGGGSNNKKRKRPDDKPGSGSAQQGSNWSSSGKVANASSDHKLRSLISKSSDAQAVLRLVARAANPDLRVHAMFQLAKLAGARAQQRPNAEGQGGDREPWASSPQWRALVTALEQDCCRREGLSARQLSKAFWAAGKLGNALPLKEQGQGPALVQLLEAKVQQLGQELDGQGCSNVWWAMATLSANSGTSSRAWEDRTLHTLERSAQMLLPQFNNQDLANFIWAAAKLRWQLQDETLEKVDAAAVRLCQSLRWQELSMTLWALASIDHCPTELLQRLPGRLRGNERALGPQGLPNVLWALAKFEGSPAVEMVQELQIQHAMCKEITIPRRPIRHVCACFDVKGDPSLLGSPVTPTQAAAAQVAGQMTPQGVANTAFALARLQAPRAEHVVADLLRPDVLRSMTWHDVGDVLWAVGTLGLEDRGQAADHLAQRVLQVVTDMDWQALGRLEHALPVIKALCKTKGPELQAMLKQQVAVRISEVNLRAGDHDSAAAAALESHPGVLEGLSGKRVLLVGQAKGSAMARAVKKACGTAGKLLVWSRFCSGRTAGSAKPPKGTKQVTAAVVRSPVSKAALALVLQDLAAILSAGEQVAICGHPSEGSGARGVEAVLAPYFSVGSLEAGKAGTRQSLDGFLVVAVRTNQAAARNGDSWTETELVLGPQELGCGKAGAQELRLPWRTFPALFAGGGLDIMTTFLLRQLPQPPRKARVLDFCCGSGTIAAALLAREPSLKLEALDADSLAVAAARVNVPAAKEVHLSDAWRMVEGDGEDARAKEARYHWIVSNPPVHRGAKDDFSVVEELLRGGKQRLRPGGSIWIVAQSYVPLKTMAEGYLGEKAGWSVEVTATDGRFKVLRCTKPLPKAKKPEAGKKTQPSEERNNGKKSCS